MKKPRKPKPVTREEVDQLRASVSAWASHSNETAKSVKALRELLDKSWQSVCTAEKALIDRVKPLEQQARDNPSAAAFTRECMKFNDLNNFVGNRFKAVDEQMVVNVEVIARLETEFKDLARIVRSIQKERAIEIERPKPTLFSRARAWLLSRRLASAS